jgi:hypothetical protein
MTKAGLFWDLWRKWSGWRSARIENHHGSRTNARIFFHDDAMHYRYSSTTMKSDLFYFLSFLWTVVVVTRTANAVERSLTVSTIVDIVGGKEYCKTPWDAQENFDNFTWWNVQIELPADLSMVGVSYNTNASASAQEDGFVQAANGEEVVLVNYTLFLSEDEDDDAAQDRFVVQWTYNDHSEWYAYEFCQNDNGRNSGVDCRDTSTRGLYFGTCWHERDGMSAGWGTTTRSASLIVSVDCCYRSSSSSTATASLSASKMTFSVAAASALATRVLLVLLGLVTLLLLLGTLLVGRKSTCSRISKNTNNTNININNNYKYYDDCNHQKKSGDGSGWVSFWLQMESSRNQASAADDHNDDDHDDDDDEFNKGNHHHGTAAIRTKQEGFTTVREFQ